VWFNGRALARDPKGRGFEPRPVRFQVPGNSLGQAAHMCLSPSSINWYRPTDGDALRVGRNSLPNDVARAESTNTFKSRLNQYWSNQEIIYDYYIKELEVEAWL